MILQLVSTLAAIAVPIVVAVVGYRLNQRLKLWEASQWRNQELIKARLQYFDRLAPMLNDLMCYYAFIGRWKEISPPEVVALKRDADRLFLSVAPLFSQRAVDAYQEFMALCFETHTGWGVDARIRSGFVRRRDAMRDRWNPEWETMFSHSEHDAVMPRDLTAIREGYDSVLLALAEDIELLSPRDRYAPSSVLYNAR